VCVDVHGLMFSDKAAFTYLLIGVTAQLHGNISWVIVILGI
jgi:hypothetical protein